MLDAALALLVERGYGEVTIEAVAARSGVAKSTIYRHWPGRRGADQRRLPRAQADAAGADRGLTCASASSPCSRTSRRNVAASQWSACLPALIDAAERDPAARELNSRLAPRRAGSRSPSCSPKGCTTGELPADLDPDLMAEALAGPIILRRLMSARPLDPARVRHLVDQVLGRRSRHAPTAPPEPDSSLGGIRLGFRTIPAQIPIRTWRAGRR